jgi:hypothetical protein
MRLNSKKENVNGNYRVFLEFRYRVIEGESNKVSVKECVIIWVTMIIAQMGMVDTGKEYASNTVDQSIAKAGEIADEAKKYSCCSSR